MDTIPNRPNPERIPSQMDTILNGQYPERRHHPEWTPSRMWHNSECTPSQTDSIPNGHNPEYV